MFRFWPRTPVVAADPGEQHELSGTEAYRPTLLAWRARMVSQFEREQRGSVRFFTPPSVWRTLLTPFDPIRSPMRITGRVLAGAG